MTRDQIKKKIEDIINDEVYSLYGSELLCGVTIAAEKIMELWDQGFAYDLEHISMEKLWRGPV